MIAEQQFESRPSRGVNFLGFAFDDHSWLDLGATGWDEFTVNLNQANEARVEGAAFLEVAEGGDVQTQRARGGQDRLARGD